MKEVAEELRAVLDVVPRLRLIDEETSSRRPAPNKWCGKEILGHLIDSALNNHQRFIRLQLQDRLDFPGYDQEGWVRVHDYQSRSWLELVDLWAAYNRDLSALVLRMDAGSLGHLWRAPDGKDVTLEFIARDYLVHTRHHLAQILKD